MAKECSLCKSTNTNVSTYFNRSLGEYREKIICLNDDCIGNNLNNKPEKNHWRNIIKKEW